MHNMVQDVTSVIQSNKRLNGDIYTRLNLEIYDNKIK